MFYQTEHVAAADHFKREEGENFSYPLHVHRCFELILVVAGEMRVTAGKEERIAQTGDAVLIFPHLPHALSSRRSRHILFIFSSELIRAFHIKYAEKLPETSFFRPEPALFAALCGLKEDDSPFRMKGLLYSAAAALEGQTAFRDRAEENDLLQKIFLYADKNCLSGAGLSDLARSLGYEKFYLSRYFKNTTGVTYNDYLNGLKTGHAADLLRSTQKSVLDCALESGYQSLRSFNRNFRRRFDCSPAEYRAAVRR